MSKIYSKSSRPALDKVTIDIPEGDFAFLVGPSGSGKSTLIKLLMLEDTVTSGRIEVNGRNLSTMEPDEIPAYRSTVGLISQLPMFVPEKTVYDNVALVLVATGKSSLVSRQVPEILELCHLGAMGHRYPHELATAPQRWLSVARTIAHKPRILLADDPISGVDPDSAIRLMRVMDSAYSAAGCTVLIATNNSNIVNMARRRVIELNYGVVVRDQQRGVYA